MGRKDVVSMLGKGAPSEELETIGCKEIEELVEVVAPALDGIPNPPMAADEFGDCCHWLLRRRRPRGSRWPGMPHGANACEQTHFAQIE